MKDIIHSKITIIYLLILAFPEGRGLADLFMLFRETIFFVIGIPAIYLTLRSILFLRRGRHSLFEDILEKGDDD